MTEHSKMLFGALKDGTVVNFWEPSFDTKQEAQHFLELVQRMRSGAECCCYYCGKVGTEADLAICNVTTAGPQEFAHRECFDRAVGGPTHERRVEWTVLSTKRPLP